LTQICNHYAIAILSVLLLSGTGLAADASMKDDAYHYMRNSIDDNLYNEWWYFNAISNNSQFFVFYLLCDPDNLTGSGKLQVLAAVLEDGKPPVIGLRQSRGFGGDRNSPTLDLDQSGFALQDESSLNVWGRASDETSGTPISWNLIYQPAVSPWFAIPVQEKVGHTKGGWMKWLAYMPSANVSGSLTLGESVFKVDGTGYHDHCWGRWALNDPQFAWAQCSIPKEGFSLTLGDILGEQQRSYLGIKFEGRTIIFSGKQVRLNMTRFANDPQTAETYPSRYEVVAENNDFLLNMTANVQKTVPLMIDYPAPAPSYLVFQQVSDLQGVLYSKTGREYQFDAVGFTGYTTPRM